MDSLDRSVTEALRAWRVQHGAGVSISQALSTSGTVCDFAAGRRCFEAAAESVTRGESIEQTVAALKPLLSEGEAALIIAGWKSGRVEACMDGVISQRELWGQARSKIRSGMALPAVVLIIAAFVAPLPAFIAGGDAFTYLLSAAAPLLVAFVAWKILNATLNARTPGLDAILLKLPIIGMVERQRSLAEFSTLLSLLISAGVPILQALKICAKGVVNTIYRDEIMAVEAVVSKGQPLSTGMKARNLWPVEFISAIVVGETSGALDDLLMRLGNASRDRYVMAIDTMAQWIPRFAYGLVAIFIIVQIFSLLGSLAGIYTVPH
ncbi:MAG TPA: type II secretion system F family protein [Planctomycetota bacterium]|nr:type II secretion system F family protein [Planctomycetota bacterium]